MKKQDQWTDWFTVNAEQNIAALTKLRDKGHGTPYDPSTAEMFFARHCWERILTRMIIGFDAALRLADELPCEEPREVYQQLFSEGMALYTEHYFKLWD